VDEPGQSNLSPLSGLQFFGEVNIHAHSGDMTVDLHDISGMSVFSKTLRAASW
jgi:alkaline phosphatase D